jgi:hypothetical protein
LEILKDYYIKVVPTDASSGSSYPYIEKICIPQGCAGIVASQTVFSSLYTGDHTITVRGHNYTGGFTIFVKPVPTAVDGLSSFGSISGNGDEDMLKVNLEYSNYYDFHVGNNGGAGAEIYEACSPSGICQNISSSRHKHFYADEQGDYTFKVRGSSNGQYSFTYTSLPRADADEIGLLVSFEDGDDEMYIQSAMEYMAEFEKKYSFKVITTDHSTGSPRFMEICPNTAEIGAGSGQCRHNTLPVSDKNHMHLEGMTVQSTGNYLVRIEKHDYSSNSFAIDVLGTND